MYVGRIVAFVVTPIVAGITAWFVPWAAENLPGHPNLDRDNLTLLAVAGVVAVGGAAYKWLDNRGKSEQIEASFAGQQEAAQRTMSPGS
jgi:hypothetical protein